MNKRLDFHYLTEVMAIYFVVNKGTGVEIAFRAWVNITVYVVTYAVRLLT